jgi:hypothetical protein
MTRKFRSEWIISLSGGDLKAKTLRIAPSVRQAECVAARP